MLLAAALRAHERSGRVLAAFLVGYVVMFVLYLAIVLYAVNVLRSVVQEKTNRVVEIGTQIVL